jgi:dephospho-CoA kinase
MIVIGLTGGIASGKSTVSRVLSDLGAVVIDADRVGHEAFRPDTDAWREVVAAFGNDVLGQNQEIDRGKLAAIVFQDPEALERLNSIMHPTIRRMVEQRIDTLRSQGVALAVVEAALLIEAGWTDLVDRVWVTDASEDAVIGRLCDQKGFTGEQARARINSQMSAVDRSKHADVVIRNDSDVAALTEKVKQLWQGIRPSDNN